MDNVNVFPGENAVHQGPAVKKQFVIELLLIISTFLSLIYLSKV